MGGDEDEQWTYVAGKGGKTNRKTSRRRTRNARNNKAAASGSSCAASSSFYASSNVAEVDKGQDGDNDALAQLTEEQLKRIRDEARVYIAQIMGDLEQQPYVTHLLHSLMSSVGGDEEDKDDSNISSREYGEIVCYGIGNFLPVIGEGSSSLPRYPSAPMLQLALALVIRKHLAAKNHRSNGYGNDLNKKKEQNNTDHSGNDINVHATQQESVKMLFFEPLMTDLEQTMLQDVLCVDIIETNERGKRQAESNGTRTLFYMPHCPMRLYSNVLWANWGELLWSGNVVIYGNNFHGYDDRILSKEERADPTNAVLRIISHLIANQIDGPTSKGGIGGVESDLLVKMENAFNDCVVMTFDAKESDDGEGAGKVQQDCFPDRPEEYVFDEEGDGEVI